MIDPISVEFNRIEFDDESGMAYLEERARHGDQDAQQRLSGEPKKYSHFTGVRDISAAFFFHFYNAISG